MIRRATLLLLVLLAATLHADDSALDAFVAKVKKGMSDVKTTRGRFKQTKKLAVFDDKVESAGSFVIERPDHLRWEVTSPFKSILVIAGDKGARWNENRKGTERFLLSEKPGIDAAVKQMFTWYSGRFDDVKGPFEITVEKDGRTISLVPKNDKVREVMSRISITFAEGFATIASIAMEEKGGDRTDIVFEDVKVNEKLDAGAFEIDKPEK